jgi:aspartate kinase
MVCLIVSKYGGTSILYLEHVEQIRRITNDDPRRKVIILSAPGKLTPDDLKVTDMLIELVKSKDPALLNVILSRYHKIYPFRLNQFRRRLTKRLNQHLEEKAYLDSIKAEGEEENARLLAKALGAEYVDPRELFVVTPDFGNARILPESDSKIRRRLGNLDHVVVIPGFYGYTKDKFIATFSRGGSDLTGSYIAKSLDAIVYENFTDRDGVFAADPKLVENPKKISELTFEEQRDLSYSGFDIFHAEAVEPVAEKGIPVHVRNAATYPAIGTYIVSDRLSDPKKPMVGVAYKNGFCSVDIAMYGLNEMLGIGWRVLKIFADEKVSIEYPISSIDDISIVFQQDQLKSQDSLGNIMRNLKDMLGTKARVEFKDNLGALVVAGKGLKGTVGVSADIQLTLAATGINLEFITQGSQQRCIVYGVKFSDGKKAVNAIYDKYLR